MSTDTASTEGLQTLPTEGVWRPSAAGRAARRGTLAALIGGLLVLTAVVPDFQANRIALAVIFAIVGLSMNMLLGYAGQISLGHHAFVGIGAFTAGFVATELQLPFFAGIIAASLIGAFAALVLGGVALRVTGLYLALVTLAFGFVTERTIFLFRPFTGGGAGMPADRPAFAESDAVYAYVCFGFLALVLFVDWRFVKTRAGRAVQAVRDSENVAASMGISAVGHKLLAFMLSGMMAGLAGGLIAHRDTVVVAAPFTFSLGLTFVIMTVVGGLRSRTGIVIGPAIFALLPTFLFEQMMRVPGLSNLLEGLADPQLIVLILGPLLLIGVLVGFPGGIGQLLQPVIHWFAGERFDVRHIRGGGPAGMGGSDVRP